MVHLKITIPVCNEMHLLYTVRRAHIHNFCFLFQTIICCRYLGTFQQIHVFTLTIAETSVWHAQVYRLLFNNRTPTQPWRLRLVMYRHYDWATDKPWLDSRQRWRCFYSASRPHRLWNPHSLLLDVYQRLFVPGWSGQGKKLCLHASIFLRSVVLNHKDNRTCKSRTVQWSRHMYIRVMANRTVIAIHKCHQWVGLGTDASTFSFSSSSAGPSFPES